MKKILLYCSVILFTTLVGCVEREVVFQNTPASLTISQLLLQDTACTQVVQALDSAKLKVMLNSYGSYTFFVPTNEAIKKYLAKRGFQKVSDISGAEWRKILFYHMYSSIYSSNAFMPGTLPGTTASGEYMGMDISGGVNNTILNRTVKVTTLDIMATNGVYHKVDAVLEPISTNMLDFLTLDGNFSIMTEAILKTGLYTLLNNSDDDPAKRLRYTAFLETDSLLKANGINSFSDLAKKYSKLGNYTDDGDSLNIFVRYHILPKNLFLSEFTNSYTETLHAQDFIVLSTDKGVSVNPHNVYTLNKLTGNVDTTFVKTNVLQSKSNLLVKNGIVHAVDKILDVHWPEPVEVTLPFVKDCSKFPTCSGSFTFTSAESFANLGGYITWYPLNQPMQVTTSNPGQNVASNLLRFDPKDKTYYVEMTTDPILKGTYKVCYSWRRISGSVGVPTIDFNLDGVKIAYIDQQQSRAYTPTGTVITKDINGNTFTLMNDVPPVPLTTVTYSTVQSHVIRMQCAVGGVAYLDAVKFVPVK
jgi:uncharacterized surface protein with fasciclin (FAS1) repeats